MFLNFICDFNATVLTFYHKSEGKKSVKMKVARLV